MSEHTCINEKSIGNHDARLNTLENIVEKHDKAIFETLSDLLGEIKVIGNSLLIVSKNQETLAADIEKLTKEKEAKGTVDKLANKLEELTDKFDKKELEEAEEKLQSYEDLKKTIIRWLIGSGVFVVGSLVTFAIIIIGGLANSGALPTP